MIEGNEVGDLGGDERKEKRTSERRTAREYCQMAPVFEITADNPRSALKR